MWLIKVLSSRWRRNKSAGSVLGFILIIAWLGSWLLYETKDGTVNLFPDIRPFIYRHWRLTAGVRECSPSPDTLRGRQPVLVITNMSVVIAQNSDVRTGGEWKPRDCLARQSVAIIIPYRDRAEHLVVQMGHLHPMMQRQKLHYRVFLVEQLGREEFNKGAIMNTAFVVANDTMDVDCLVFHDVDLIAMDDRNYYGCSDKPRHLSVAIDSFDFNLPYPTLVGGVLAIAKEEFVRTNGYSNKFWGWGAEDDDMYDRMLKNNITIERPNKTVAVYHKNTHSDKRRRDPGYNQRIKLLRSQQANDRSRTDGITSLNSRVVAVENHPLYTRITVDVGKAPPLPPSVIFSFFSFLKRILS